MIVRQPAPSRAVDLSDDKWMSERDRLRWNAAYLDSEPPASQRPVLPTVFSAYADVFPVAGTALDLACGHGAAAIWLALRGLKVWGVDASDVAIAQARDWAARTGVAARCTFDVVDLDEGLPPGP